MDPVPPRRFVEVWQTCADVAEVAKKLRMKRAACRLRALRYRRRGVPLRELPAGGCSNIDWDDLVQYAGELGEMPAKKGSA